MQRPTARQRAASYGLAILFSASAIGARSLLADTTNLVFVTFYPAVMAAGWFGGGGPALFAVGLCALAGDYFWMSPRGHLLPTTVVGWTNFALFATVGAAIGVVSGRLRQVQSRFRSVLELTSDGFAIVDRAWRIVYANPRFAAMVGRRAGDIVGRLVWDVLPESGDFPFGDVARRAMDGERATFASYHAGLGRWFEASVYPLPEGIAILSRDVSALKELEVRRGEQLERLETANRMKDEFLATLSHELRTPLNAVMGWTHMVRHHTTDADRGLAAVERNAALLKQLVDDLLDTSRIVTGKLVVCLEPVDLAAIVGDSIEAVRGAAQSRHVTLSASGVQRAVPMSGDAARLRQAVSNVLTNAVKFTPERGQVEVSLEVTSDEAILRVKDTGVGIDSRLLPRVFDRFVQGDTPTNGRQGLGLGLAIAKHVVDTHGGHITARSDGVMRGSVFTVTLPLEHAAAPAASAETGAKRA